MITKEMQQVIDSKVKLKQASTDDSYHLKNKWAKLFKSLCFIVYCSLSTTIIFAQGNEASSDFNCGVTQKSSESYFAEIRGNINVLRQSQPPKAAKNSRTLAVPSVKFIWPLKPNNISNFTYYRITNYVDLDPDTIVRDANGNYISGLRDYNCGTRTYDGHNGLDITLIPYHWEMQFDSKVSVIAAADGIVVGRSDGNYDGECATGQNRGWGNWIALMHEDSTVTTYVHLKQNSVLNRSIGTWVERGQFLGYVASAGNSSGPHLHFGVYINNSFGFNGGWSSDNASLVEPFSGSCNSSYSSFWLNQKPYNDPSVVSIETHRNLPGMYENDCDKDIDLSFDKTFDPGNIVYLRTWFRDWVDGSPVTVQVINPSGTTLATWIHSNTNNRRETRRDNAYLLSGSAPTGTYTVRVLFDGKIWERHFTVGCQQNYTVTGTVTGPKGYIAGNRITTTQVIENGTDNRVEYHADTDIIFLPGFHAKRGSTVIADRKGCTGGYH